MYGQNQLKIKVPKDELLKILKENRQKHSDNYDKAKVGFRKLLIQELEKKLASANAGKKVALSFKNRKPDNNLDDYDEVIGMLELDTNNIVELDAQQYKQYVKDDWAWSGNWTASNSLYMSAA